MSFHPNDMRRRGVEASVIILAVMIFLSGGFFRGQVLQYQKYATQSETNRMREIPLPAARGVIYDRNGLVIADNVVGYSVSVLALREDSLRSILTRLGDGVRAVPGRDDGHPVSKIIGSYLHVTPKVDIVPY